MRTHPITNSQPIALFKTTFAVYLPHTTRYHQFLLHIGDKKFEPPFTHLWCPSSVHPRQVKLTATQHGHLRCHPNHQLAHSPLLVGSINITLAKICFLGCLGSIVKSGYKPTKLCFVADEDWNVLLHLRCHPNRQLLG